MRAAQPRPRASRHGRLVLAALATAGAALGLAVAAYLVSPLFIRTSLVEPAPAATTDVVLARGAFDEKDSVHRGSGTATLVRTPDGRVQLRLDDFRVTNGPDLYVYLSGSPKVSTSEDLHMDELNLGRLKASEGQFAYDVDPGAVDLARVRSAVIYCRAFRVVFSSAELTAPG